MAKRRPTVRTPKTRERFIAALDQGLSITSACEAAGMTRSAAYDWRKADPNFAEAWEDAVEAGTDRLEDRVLAKAHRMDDGPAVTAAIFLLKARRPKKYRDHHQIEHSGGIDVTGAREKLMEMIERQQNAGPQDGE